MFARDVAHRGLLSGFAILIATVLGSERAEAGGFLNPSSFSTIGSLTNTNTIYGDLTRYEVNSSGTLPTLTMPDGSVVKGVISPDGTTAVFCFSSINLTNVAIVAEGSLPVALLSTGSVSMTGVTVDASSYDGPQTIMGNYQTPSTGVGAGGYTAGGGPGGGGYGYGGGGGGGYGGAGGSGGDSTGTRWVGLPSNGPPTPVTVTFPGSTGGGTYGGSGAPLQGGSAGGSVFGDGTSSSGAGGGAIQIGASGSLTMNDDRVLANGASSQAASAGGGSGGEIAITGSDVNISDTLLSAVGVYGGPSASFGGDGGGTDGYGGEGGGGRIEVDGVSVNFSGTADVGGANPGTFIVDPLPPAVPEPSSIVMLGMAVAIAGGYCWRRRSGRLPQD